MTSAVEEVMSRVSALLTGAGITVLEDRDEDEAINSADTPCAALSFGGAQHEVPEMCNESQFRHRGTIMIDLWQGGTTLRSIQSNCNELVADVAAALNDDITLGGVGEIMPVSTGGYENVGKDIGAISLEVSVIYYTSASDWKTLLT